MLTLLILRHAKSGHEDGLPDEARTLRFGRPGEIAELFEAAGLVAVEESTLQVASTYADFDELWAGFLAGVGPAGAFTVGLDPERQAKLREALFRRVGEPGGAFTLAGLARCAVARTPS